MCVGGGKTKQKTSSIFSNKVPPSFRRAQEKSLSQKWSPSPLIVSCHSFTLMGRRWSDEIIPLVCFWAKCRRQPPRWLSVVSWRSQACAAPSSGIYWPTSSKWNNMAQRCNPLLRLGSQSLESESRIFYIFLQYSIEQIISLHWSLFPE